MSTRPGTAQPPAETTTSAPSRLARVRAAAASRGVPLATILVAVAVVALTYLGGNRPTGCGMSS